MDRGCTHEGVLQVESLFYHPRENFASPRGQLGSPKHRFRRWRIMIRFSVLLVLLFFLQDTKCLASTPGAPATRVISVRKNGGESKVFEFAQEKLGAENTAKTSSLRTFRLSTLRQTAVSALRSTFLPSGYPSRTPPGYLKYCMFSWTQDFTTQLRSVIATQRVLEGVGVGREGATALSALMNYLVRDGCGMAATLLFTSAASSKFRSDVKRWRLFADIMVDVGITLEVMAVLVPRSFFLPMISIGNMCKAMCGVAAGACGGSINLHWAKGSDISDINAKFGAQHTVTGALGLIFAAFFARSVDHVNTTIMWTLYASLTAVHIVANAWCMRLIAFDSCNTARMNMLLEEFFGWWQAHEREDDPQLPSLSTPQEIAKKEPLFFTFGKAVKPPGGLPIHLGVSFDEFWEANRMSQGDVEQVQSMETTMENYLVTVTPKGSVVPHAIPVVLMSHVTGYQEAKAYFHANWLGRESQRLETNDENSSTLERMHLAWNYFVTCAQRSGWDLSKTELTTAGYEVNFAT